MTENKVTINPHHKHTDIYTPNTVKTERENASPYLSILENNFDSYKEFCSWAR